MDNVVIMAKILFVAMIVLWAFTLYDESEG